jgi:D-alanyl-D-alanine carboxypeptidase (penicillin-binding protein 5/6)
MLLLVFTPVLVMGQEVAEPVHPDVIPQGAPTIQARSAVLLDQATGAVLYSLNADEQIPPASMTKLMTMHIALSEVEQGKASLDEVVALPPDSWAENQPPRSSLMHLARGQSATLNELLLGLAIPSGNDAAVAVARRFSPSVAAFAQRMNAAAAQFGMKNTHFVEPSGVDARNLTTAWDYAFFCKKYIELHPEAIKDYHSVREFDYPTAENVPAKDKYDPKTYIQYNHNTLLGVVPGVDGLKTGYIDESGYNIALTAMRENPKAGGSTRFVLLIMGEKHVSQRDIDGTALLDWAFAHYHTLRILIAAPQAAPLYKGKTATLALVPAEGSPGKDSAGNATWNFCYTAPVERGLSLSYHYKLKEPLVAPLSKGSIVGSLDFSDSMGSFRSVPLLSREAAPAGPWWKRAVDTVRLWFFHAD